MTPAALTAELETAYTEEAALYTEALRWAEQLERREQAADTVLPRVAELLAQVQLIEDRLASAKSSWRDAGCRASGNLADLLERVTGMIRLLQSRLADAHREAEQQRCALSPALDDLICQQNMRRAYGAAASATLPTGGIGHAG